MDEPSTHHHRALIRSVALCASLALLSTGEGLAQDRGFVAVSGALQPTESRFDERVETIFNAETALEGRSYEVESGSSFDVSAGAFVWRRLVVGGGVSRFSKTGGVRLSGSLPHPFFFGRSRDVSGSARGLGREEVVVYAHAGWSLPVTDRLDVTILGGPAFFSVDQDLVTQTLVNDPFPFTSVSVASVQSTRHSESTVGFHLGADVAFFFSRHFGVGGLFRFSRGSVSLPSGGGSIAVDVGGVHAGAGLRLRF